MSQYDAILYYLEELTFLNESLKKRLYSGKLKDFEEFKEYYLKDLQDIISGIENHKTNDFDPTPYCSHCGAIKKIHCNCGPIAEND